MKRLAISTVCAVTVFLAISEFASAFWFRRCAPICCAPVYCAPPIVIDCCPPPIIWDCPRPNPPRPNPPHPVPPRPLDPDVLSDAKPNQPSSKPGRSWIYGSERPHLVLGTFKDFEDGKVRISRSKDGSTVSVTFQKLSGADQKLVVEEHLLVNRTWTDSSGQHHLMAKFRGINRGIVTLEAVDGREVKVPLARLCGSDQIVVGVFNDSKAADIASLASSNAR